MDTTSRLRFRIRRERPINMKRAGSALRTQVNGGGQPSSKFRHHRYRVFWPGITIERSIVNIFFGCEIYVDKRAELRSLATAARDNGEK